jgi:diguanylate cyclase (GGDEF)-like protein
VRFEEALLRFARELEGVEGPTEVEAVLLRLARELVHGDRIALSWTTGEGANRPAHGLHGDGPPVRIGRSLDARAGRRDDGMTELPLRCGGAVYGRLLVSHARGSSAHPPAVHRRLAIACTMAACALENLRQHSEWGWNGGDEPAEDGRSRTGEAKPGGVIRDATFLNAVLPFALGQAKRHFEPISLLCLAIDRLGAIQDLLGPGVVDRLVQEVCQVVASSIRSSDIVARLDDDRIIVLLIRARTKNARYVAEKISRSVAEKTQHAAELGCATVSIGIAEFPDDAHTALSLLDAADDALARAQDGGRNRIAVAEAPTVSPATSPDAVASASSPY